MTSPSLYYLNLNSNNFGDDELRALAGATITEKQILQKTFIKEVKENNV